MHKLPFLFLYLTLTTLLVNGQNMTAYEGGESFSVKMTDTGYSSKIPIGLGGKVIYDSFSNSYTVTWLIKDGTEQKMKFKFLGKLEDVNLFQEEAGKQYAIDVSNLNTEGAFFALLVDLKTGAVTDKGILITKLKRK